jgi:hypothetical protein
LAVNRSSPRSSAAIYCAALPKGRKRAPSWLVATMCIRVRYPGSQLNKAPRRYPYRATPLIRVARTPIYRRMKGKVIVASTLAALTAGGLVGEAVVSAESAETQCEAPISCAERPPALEAWLPDMPEHGNAAHAPTTQLVETSGATSASSLPPLFVEDTTAPLHPHRLPWRPMTQAEDDGWLAATAPSPPSLGWMYEVTEIRRPSVARRAAAMQHSDEAWMFALT